MSPTDQKQIALLERIAKHVESIDRKTPNSGLVQAMGGGNGNGPPTGNGPTG